MKKSTDGISLIVLVITIIVMIILAGSIIISLNSSGIIGKASDAVKDTNFATIKTEITTNLVLQGWYEGKSVTADIFEGYLKNIPEATVTKVIDDAWQLKMGTTTVTVYQTGEIIEGEAKIWDGESAAPEIKQGNWYIYTPQQMKFFADFVNNSNSLTNEQKALVPNANQSNYAITDNTTIYLMSDLDMGARQKDGVITTPNNTEWTPIGVAKETKFTGTFEGNNHVIRGVYVDAETIPVGLFGNSDTIQNLTIRDSYIKTTGQGAGGIVGALREGTISNCHNIATTVIAGIYSSGGIVGQFTGTMLSDCTNTGNVQCGKTDDNNSQSGGIAGRVARADVTSRKCECKKL